MKLPTVDRFLFYFSLEIGAFVLAVLSITGSISIVALASWLLTRYVSFFGTLNESDQNFFRPFLITFIIVYCVYILYFLIVIVASVMLVIGTRRRDHNQMLLFLILMAIGVIVSFLQIIQLGFLFLVPSLLGAVCSIYFFICVFSLYKIFKNDAKQTNGRHTQYENVVLRNL